MTANYPEVDDFLEHFGVKGMKWGVIHDDPKSGSDTSSSQASFLKREKGPIPLNAEDKKVVQQLGLPTGHVANELMRKKYGPPDPDTPPPAPPKKGLTPGQKEALFYGAIGVGLVGYIAFTAYKGNKELTLSGENLPSFKKFLDGSNTVKSSVFDPRKLSDDPVFIKAGDIVKRVSMVKETKVRSDGFFAAYKPEDVTRYKAALPVYWKMWGHNVSQGYVNNYQAIKDVKSPSAKGTYDLIQSFFKEGQIRSYTGREFNARKYMETFYKSEIALCGKDVKSDGDLALFVSQLWTQDAIGRVDPVAKSFFDYAKSKGFNALVDLNDAGSLGQTPIRFIDGAMFKTVGSEDLTIEGIKKARELVTAIAHALRISFDGDSFMHRLDRPLSLRRDFMEYDNVDDFLEHFGVKGMKWGVIKSDLSSYNSNRKARYSELRNSTMSELTVKTKYGKTVTVTEDNKTKLASFLGSLSQKASEKSKAYKCFTFSADGKKVGSASFNWDSKEKLNLVWLGVNAKERGKGYGAAVFESSIAYAKSKGAKEITLEVPGNAPDAKHIYEKQGFISGKQISPSGDIWGGLTEMTLDLTKSSMRHSDLSNDEVELELALSQTFIPLPPIVEDEVFHSNMEEACVSTNEVDDFLEHFGVLGMKWGVNRAAKKDATEFARAKMYYGEGAGTRRKLIKARVEAKSSDPVYKQAFDKHLSNQDMAKRAAEAKVKRKTTDVVKTTTKTGRGVINIVNGNPMAASAVAVAVVAGAKYAHDSGVDRVVANAGKTAYSKIKTEVRAMRIKQQFKNWMG